MSIEANKALVSRYFDEVWNQGRSESIDALCAADGVVHGLQGEKTQGLDQLKAFHARLQQAFSPQRVVIEEMIAERDLVTVRWSRTATHSGHGLPIAPTNTQLKFHGVSIMRVEHGKIVEGWNYYDRLGMLQQLGQIPATLSI